ncbi:hypothetical protein EJ02DRAFT_469219 [Clathrospora elynae]|uniref:Uncharacterized protein n=1 Tax=Clathrospora elynae TaxID=706981 RepID=A0A6A5SBQ5_9PLEO|nr:hypothetical protein EJ02DRAFT_469219 [Clathrospora elynae]
MATSNQFQEPPVAELPEATSNTSTNSTSDFSTQFQEPLPLQSTPQSSATADTDGGALHKSTIEKLKDVVKKPFSGSLNTLGKEEVDTPELAAANEVLEAKNLKSS